MKKFISIMFLLFSFYIFSTLSVGMAEGSYSTVKYSGNESELELQKKLAELQREMYIQSLIQYIEFESEVIIPDEFDVKYVEYAFNLANELQIPTRMTFRLIFKESSFIDSAISRVGAKGLMQLMPETRETYYELLRVDTLNLDKNQEDIYIGMNYLRDLYEFWADRGNSEKFSWRLGLASYNAGKGRVLQYKGVPPYKETQDFVVFILKAHSNPDFFAHYTQKYGNEIKDRS
jgi:soluble lytic murein transglycosylase-like protein